uniref:PH domain-containing protein n=1 Tax=Octactis speculum TaxID=3111310 RepID=A0A7S2C803_9STRA|mmetsp:Transcript_32593/g.44092  ORF Transcript_32593/g.44092 Transcript_32593/m.44092 type:complete len:190 (+) Transcript_32593:1-570(+)|eukprot:CAMPEP_0185754178 /NCGR_PEP_ID=MMETSP1174-20130828/12825_1 /TAXON_ID=35687 /ORGANISM="Dictyocha speculum, Strain CCMP1381" /LENGTH=189 /DNA_ID=CAMNT_0028432277 /DNA_START=1 /DNA_END=570 /DNA_ORIENTATION=-
MTNNERLNRHRSSSYPRHPSLLMRTAHHVESRIRSRHLNKNKESSDLTSHSYDLAHRCGYVEKKGGGLSAFGSTRWQTRFVVVDQGMLTYYLKREDYYGKKHPLKDAVYNLANCSCTFLDMLFRLEPQTPEAGPKTIEFKCATHEDYDAWKSTIMVATGTKRISALGRIVLDDCLEGDDEQEDSVFENE